VADQPLPRTKDDFERLLAAGRQRIAWAVQEVVAVARPLFEGYHQASLAIEEFSAARATTTLPSPAPRAVAARRSKPTLIGGAPASRSDGHDATVPRWQYAIDDMREQIAELMDPRWFAKTPWHWLRQYPRYFRALGCRLEDLPGGVPRDWQKFQEFQPRRQLYLEHARHQQAQGIVDPELLLLRWMLEEYRVSLFAQKLGTAIPVSPKRLEQQWAKVRA
jgi:ATP-dependent helicase HrpA